MFTCEGSTQMMCNYSKQWMRNSALLASLLLAACGEIAYKRGASASDLDKTKKACVAQDSSKTAVEKCMADNGWVVQNLESSEPIATMQNEPDPVIEASVTTDNRQTKKLGISSNNVTGNKAVNTPENKKPANPMDTFKIGSWWKLGGDAGNLKSSIQECVTTLGEAFQPESQTKKVTRGLLLCMKDKGWHGLREK